jgi:hypothetical protein
MIPFYLLPVVDEEDEEDLVAIIVAIEMEGMVELEEEIRVEMDCLLTEVLVLAMDMEEAKMLEVLMVVVLKMEDFCMEELVIDFLQLLQMGILLPLWEE